MNLDEYLRKELNLTKKESYEIAYAVEQYKKTKKRKLNIRIPKYTIGEEIFNSVSHGIGAILSIVALILMVIKANGALAETTVAIFGSTMIILYTISCIYHALSCKLEGKKILRILDHCNVYLLVYGTYIPISLLGIGGTLGWILFGFVSVITLIGIILTSIKIDQFQLLEVICHLLNGWSVLIGIPKLLQTINLSGLFFLILGGVMYTLGSILYGIGANKKYMHSVFHIFCLFGTFFHFWTIYCYVL